MIKHKLSVLLVVDAVFYLLFVVSVFSQGQLYTQEYYTPSTLTRTTWSFTTITVRNFYYYGNGTVVPGSGVTVVPNYPAIIGVVFMLTNMVFIAYVVKTLRNADSKAPKE